MVDIRAHYTKPVVDSQGNLLPNIHVRVLQPGTQDPIADTLYADGLTLNTLSNPFVADDGVIDFYLGTPQRVRLGVTSGADPEVFFDDIDVLVPDPAYATWYQTVQDENGDAVPQHGTIEFTGTGVAVTDDGVNSRTVVTITAGGLVGNHDRVAITDATTVTYTLTSAPIITNMAWVTLNAAVLDEGADYTLDYTTGVITLDSSLGRVVGDVLSVRYLTSA